MGQENIIGLVMMDILAVLIITMYLLTHPSNFLKICLCECTSHIVSYLTSPHKIWYWINPEADMKSLVCNFGNLLSYMTLILHLEPFKEKGFKII